MASILNDIYYITGLCSFLKKLSKDCPAYQRAYAQASQLSDGNAAKLPDNTSTSFLSYGS